MRIFSVTSLFIAVLLLPACAVGPDYQKPDVSTDASSGAEGVVVTTHWQTDPAKNVNEKNTVSDKFPAQRNWWQAFNDPLLADLIKIAREQNLDLRSASERIREARAYLDGANADLLPEISAYGGAARRSDQAGSRSGTTTIRNERGYEAGFDASWEIDLFGGLRRQREAREADLGATIADRDDVELSLLSEVARVYIEYRLAEYDYQLATRTLAAQEKTARITEARYKQGVDGRLELDRARVALANTRARQPAAKAVADAARFQLGFLLAKSPDELTKIFNKSLTENSNKTLPTAELDSVLELPVDVIATRPDVRLAERQLAAATARTGVAVAARYPRITISGLLGFDADNGDSLYDSDSRIWSLSADLLLPLIDFGRRADIEAADAQQAQALLSYERSVRNALADVDTALSNYVREREQLATYTQATLAARSAWNIANKQYLEGVLPQLDVLIAQRTLFDAELNEAQSRASLATRFVTLNKALGRGLEQQVK